MNSLFVFSEIYTNGYRVEVLNIMFLLSVLCGILVIITKNPIVSVLFLIGLFVSIAGYLSLLGLNFIGLSYLLVYIGAMSIWFIYVLIKKINLDYIGNKSCTSIISSTDYIGYNSYIGYKGRFNVIRESMYSIRLALRSIRKSTNYGIGLNVYTCRGLILIAPFTSSTALNNKTLIKATSLSLGRDLHKKYTVIQRGEGNYVITTDGRKIFDASTGAAVACLGYGNKRVIKAITEQMDTGIVYLASSFWASDVVENLCKELIKGTDDKMALVYLTGSGSEAMEAVLKLSRQYFYDVDNNTSRVNYISREGSYHGNTLGALAVSGFPARKKPYSPILMENVYRISACYPYRQRLVGETDRAFVNRKAAELDAKFQELGPQTVIAFIAEPIVGAALGCVPCVPGYLKAMQEVCHKYGALFILDEVMCGSGRTGTMHVWQAENVIPDIQIMAKGLGGGYQPIAGMLINHKVAKVLRDGSGQFVHGHTYQSMPVQAVVALEIQRIIRDDHLLGNVTLQGAYLEKKLKDLLGNHPCVGDIRGRGLFWGIEFVKDKTTKEPFDPEMGIAKKIQDLAMSSPFNMTVYPGTGSADGVRGDHIILAPSYYVKKEDVNHIVKVLSAVIHIVFNNIDIENKLWWKRGFILIRNYYYFLKIFFYKKVINNNFLIK